jgi:DNA-binding transcriptional LysR family regulator
MELRQLRHLIAVVEHGSFSRAAEAVHLTQPALSRSIQALEASVGAPVLERHRGAIEPTDVGRLLLTHARQLDSATRDLERDIALTQGLELGELRIGVGPYGGSALVGPALGRLNLAHPGLRLKTVLAPWQELPDRARARDVDLIVVELSQVQLMDDFAVQALSEHGLVVVCQPRHPLTLMDSPTLADVFSYPVAGPSLTPALTSLLQDLPPREPARPAARSAACWRWSATCRACSRTCCATATPSR